MDKKIVLRSLFPSLQDHLDEEEITVLLGPRQAGKTTLILQMKKALLESGISSSAVYYFNLDVVADQQLFKQQPHFVQFIKNRLTGQNKLYIFIDEVQRIENPGLFFKGIYDLRLSVKLVLTGSSSLEIRSKINEPLTGRKRLFKLYPLSFSEYLLFREKELMLFLDKKDDIALAKILQHLDDFIVFGGYPKIIVETIREKKIQHLEEIFTSYVEKDVIGLLKVRDSFIFSQLVKIAAFGIGNLFNVAGIAREVGVKGQTIQHYLDILQETFVVYKVNPFVYSPTTEIRKMPKMYFFDTGMRNFAKEARDFSLMTFSQRDDKGSLLENFILSELLKLEIGPVRFWRTKDDAEVDFVIQKKNQIVPIEIKSGVGTKSYLSRSLHSFINKYQPKTGIIVTMGNKEIIKVGKTELHCILPYQLPQFISAL